MDARKWIEDVLGEKVAWGSDDAGPGSGFADALKSGEVLCKYAIIIIIKIIIIIIIIIIIMIMIMIMIMMTVTVTVTVIVIVIVIVKVKMMTMMMIMIIVINKNYLSIVLFTNHQIVTKQYKI